MNEWMKESGSQQAIKRDLIGPAAAAACFHIVGVVWHHLSMGVGQGQVAEWLKSRTLEGKLGVQFTLQPG